ncbi:hypothetical protein CLCR_05806 [Cladophialophora carrionii]|uniref:Uncharacterized protein n=1 Tax=Cladophialophora carrionii TaxID=86049 RepID=A0A1C1C9W8_9EURO|nr:hypothetical protein CLCR_05806 [Cladophialophora carrionii]
MVRIAASGHECTLMGMPLEIRRKILQELLTIDANHKTLIVPPSTCYVSERYSENEYHEAAVRQQHTCTLHSGIMSTCKRFHEEGREILLEENHFVAIVGNQKLFFDAMAKWNVHALWVPEKWAGKWSRKSTSFELDQYHFSPSITIAYKPTADDPMMREAPVLIPAQHLSLAVLAVLGVHLSLPETGPIELYFHTRNGNNIFGGKQPFTVEELQKKIFIWLGKYSSGFRWCWSPEALDEREKQSRAETEEKVLRAFQETKATCSKQAVEESAMYDHLRGFVVEMDVCLDEDKQAEAFSKFQEFALQTSAAQDKAFTDSFAARESLPLAYVGRTRQLYAYACYRITSLTNPERLGWHTSFFHAWCIDRALLLRCTPGWRWWLRGSILMLRGILAFSYATFLLHRETADCMMQDLVMLGGDVLVDEVVDENGRRKRGADFLRQRLQHLPIWPESTEVQKPGEDATAEDIKAALLDTIRDLERESNFKYGHVGKLKDQAFDKDEWASSSMQS